MPKICKRMEVWSDPNIIVMDYDDYLEEPHPKGCVTVFVDYSPKSGKVYSIEESPEDVTTLFLDQDGIKALIEVLQEFVE